MAKKDNLPTIEENKSGLGARINTSDLKTKNSVMNDKKSRSGSRALVDLSTDEKEAIVSTLLSAITALKTDVDASNTLITALVPALMMRQRSRRPPAQSDAVRRSEVRTREVPQPTQ